MPSCAAASSCLKFSVNGPCKTGLQVLVRSHRHSRRERIIQATETGLACRRTQISCLYTRVSTTAKTTESLRLMWLSDTNYKHRAVTTACRLGAQFMGNHSYVTRKLLSAPKLVTKHEAYCAARRLRRDVADFKWYHAHICRDERVKFVL
jgi:hypothetical protein